MVDHAKARVRAIARFKEYVGFGKIDRSMSVRLTMGFRPGSDQGL